MKTDRVKPDRHIIDLSNEQVASRWAKHLGKSLAEIEAAMQKVGPSCEAIRKELGIKEDVC